MTLSLPAPHGNTPGIIPSLSFETLMAQRNAAVGLLETIAQAVKTYGDLAGSIWPEGTPSSTAPYKFGNPVDLRPSGDGKYLTAPKWLAHAIACVDTSLWAHLMHKSGMRSFMDAKARKEWEEQIDKNETPALTEENVAATFAHLHARRGEFFERGVVALFRSLSWDYKTNRPRKFGKKLIVRRVVNGWGHPGTSSTDALDDLERACHLLDGKPEPDHRFSVKARLWQRDKGDTRGDIVDDYLRIRTFKNGNGHVTLLRPDLTDTLNRILAKHHPNALPPILDEREP